MGKIIISTIIFAFYTTSYFTVFTGNTGKKLNSSFKFNDKSKEVNDLLHITNYFRLGCLSIFLLISSIVFSVTFGINYYFMQVFTGYLVILSVCFLRWIFNYITNIVTMIIHK